MTISSCQKRDGKASRITLFRKEIAMKNEQFDEIEQKLQQSKKVIELTGNNFSWERFVSAITEADVEISEEAGIQLTDLLRWGLEASVRIAERDTLNPEYEPDDPRR